MSNGTFALLFGKILRSSIWLDDYPTRIMWITMLLLKDKDGMVPKSSIHGLAHTANVLPEECAAAIEKFLAPDPKSGNQAEDGRRIREIDGGWQIINHEQYQFSTEAKRLAWAEHKRLQREREREKKAKKKFPRALPESKAMTGEKAHIVAAADGDCAGSDAIVNEANNRKSTQ